MKVVLKFTKEEAEVVNEFVAGINAVPGVPSIPYEVVLKRCILLCIAQAYNSAERAIESVNEKANERTDQAYRSAEKAVEQVNNQKSEVDSEVKRSHLEGNNGIQADSSGDTQRASGSENTDSNPLAETAADEPAST